MKHKEYFSKIYEEYFPYVFKIVRNHVPLKEDVEDIITEVFVDIWAMKDNIDDRGNVKSLIFTISKRKVYDFLRKKYKLDLLHIDETELESFRDKKLQKNDNNSLKNKLDNLVKNLKERDRAFYKLKYKKI